jgi:hypothetical protein
VDRRGAAELLVVVGFLATGCAAKPAPADDSCRFGTVEQALTSKCFPRSLDPVTDPANPDSRREREPRPRHAGLLLVEPSVGVGDPSTVADCPADQQQLLILTPLRSKHQAIIGCETTLE